MTHIPLAGGSGLRPGANRPAGSRLMERLYAVSGRAARTEKSAACGAPEGAASQMTPRVAEAAFAMRQPGRETCCGAPPGAPSPLTSEGQKERRRNPRLSNNRDDHARLLLTQYGQIASGYRDQSHSAFQQKHASDDGPVIAASGPLTGRRTHKEPCRCHSLSTAASAAICFSPAF